MKTRIEKLRRATIEAQPSICGERGRIVTESFRATQGEPQVIRRAIAFKDIMEQMSIVIDPDELIVGNQASRINAAPLFPEFSIDFLLDEIDEFAKRPYDRFEIDAETKETIREIAPFWKGQTHEDRVVHTTRRFFPLELLVAWEEDKFRLNDILYNGVRKSAGDGHIIPDYFKMMVGGIPGVISEAKRTLSELNYQKDSDAFQKKLFLDAVVISYEAIQHWFLRYSELAESLSTTALSENMERLLSVARNCRNLAQTAPANFHEAIQLTYFIHLLLHIESNGHSISLGRVDQYLYPFYRRDIDGGVLTDEQALELIDCMYIKISKFNKVRPWPETRLKSGAPMFMTLTLGGQTRDGKDAVNELTYRFLDALGDTRLPQPTPVVRVCSTTSNDLLIHSVQVLLMHGGGLPAFFSDEIIIPALMKMGIPQVDAREYGIAGCSEAVIPGKTFSFTGGDCYFNFVKILEVLLNEGVNPRTGICLFPAKKLEEYESIDDILVEFQRHLAKYMSYIVPLTAITSATDADLNPTPFSSGLLDYRIEMGKDMSFGGGKNALYSHTILQGHGTGDICNSLYALEQLVFKNKELTLREFSDVLRSNWEGERGLELTKPDTSHLQIR